MHSHMPEHTHEQTDAHAQTHRFTMHLHLPEHTREHTEAHAHTHTLTHAFAYAWTYA